MKVAHRLVRFAGVLFVVAAICIVLSFWIADPTGRSLAETGGVLAVGAFSSLVGALGAADEVL